MRWWTMLRALLARRCTPRHVDTQWTDIDTRQARLEPEITELERIAALRRVERERAQARPERRHGPH